MNFLLKYKSTIVKIISYAFILLFVYAAVSKLLDYENFRVQLAQSPLLTAYAGFIAPAVITVEIITAFLLLIKPLRIPGLYISLFLMASFIVYIYIILHYTEFIPCSCGGIIEKLGWNGHLIFNTVFLGFAFAGILIGEKRKRKPLFTALILLAVICTATACVGYLFKTSEHIIKKENNFTRRFIPHAIIRDKEYDLKANSYYFAGNDESHVYLGNYTNPWVLASLDTALANVQTKKIKLNEYDFEFRSLRLTINPPNFYMYDGTVPVTFKGNLKDSIAYKINIGNLYFNQLEVIDSVNFIFKARSNKTMHTILGSLNLLQDPKIKLQNKLLEKQKDGVFDTDGLLIQDNYKHSFVYTYYYRNQFLVLDNKLKLLRKLNTIDTTTKVQIKSIKLSDGRHKIASPPLQVNNKSAVYKGILFNESKLKGKFESAKSWKKATVIDMYRTQKQEYLGSFYVYNQGKERMKQILVTENYLYILIGNEILRYRFAQSITKYFKTGEAENPDTE